MNASNMSSAGESPDLRDFSGPLVLVGAGKMGGALLEGWLRFGLDPQNVAVIEPQPSPQISALAARGVRLNPDAGALDRCRRRRHRGEAANRRRGAAGARADDRRLHRRRVDHGRADAAIPLRRAAAPVRVGARHAEHCRPRSAAASPSRCALRASGAQRDLAHRLLSATGAVEWIEDEALMDAVTAVSGSGPAYVFLLAEVLARGRRRGRPAAASRRKNSRAKPSPARASCCTDRRSMPATLRENVTSPGGTTAAALEVLMGENGLAPLMNKAVAAATARSRELAG